MRGVKKDRIFVELTFPSFGYLPYHAACAGGQFLALAQMTDSFYSPVYTAFIEPKGSFPSTFKGMRLLSVEIHAEILSLVFFPVLS